MPQPVNSVSEAETPTPPKDLNALVADLPFRDPIIDDPDPDIYDQKSGESWSDVSTRLRAQDRKDHQLSTSTDRQWTAITEAARRGVLANPDLRQAMTAFATEPVSEELPKHAIDVITSKDERAASIVRHIGSKLGPLVALEPVPDEVIKPDITHAPHLKTKEDEIKSLEFWADSEHFDEMFQHSADRVADSPGISEAEKKLIARRYRYARDIKTLALMAELQESPAKPEVSEDGLVKQTLPSGTKLVIDGQAFEDTPDLLNPQKWEKRKQLKDRVYMVQVGGISYMMKERKTPRHTDTKKNGHIDGLTSEQEFMAAREFAELGVIKHGDVELKWERPLGFVEFPDGYQFCLFEVEPGLVSDPKYRLEGSILNLPDEYKEEYEQVKDRAKTIFDEDDFESMLAHDEILKKPRVGLTRRARAARQNYKDQGSAAELRYDEFANVKARMLILQAKNLLSDTLTSRGYVNSDLDGFAFTIDNSSGRPKLEIIGFDFEYYTKDPKLAQEIMQHRTSSSKSGDTADIYGMRIAGERRIITAATYAIMEGWGWKRPPNKNQAEN